MTTQHIFTIHTHGRGLINITTHVSAIVSKSETTTGICNVFLHHTSASIIIGENSDPSVQDDLETFMQRIIPDDDSLYTHTLEGPDDMPSHIRTVLTQSSITIPVTQKKLALGTWQGIFVWEHRFKGHERKLTVTVMG